MPSYEERRAVLGCEPLWSRAECALYLGISENTLGGLNVPRAAIGGVRYVPEVVREWARRQLSHELTPASV